MGCTESFEGLPRESATQSAAEGAAGAPSVPTPTPTATVAPEYLSVTGAGPRTATGLPASEQLSVRCNGQRIIVCALLRPDLRVQSIRLHFTWQDGVTAYLDVPVHALPAGRRLHAP